ncbi:MAG: hypothetical protein H6581_15145 [Bacteroidia bacterium]|nr:hypothetical protein [Bacteroidia bacterium]
MIFNSTKKIPPLILLLLLAVTGMAQQFPGKDENIPFLITFGKNAPTSWGDDDYTQIFFFAIPKDQRKPIYIRVFDPDVGGENDELKTVFDSRTRFSVYGGKGAISNEDATFHQPVGEYDSGTLLDSKVFGVEPKYDNNWYTFGPFNPNEGENSPEYGGFVFKMICEGISGDDGNTYLYFLSEDPERNVPVEGANAFTFEYTFRLPNKPSVCHIYPYIDNEVISVQQHNFDWDGDGLIRIVSVAKQGEKVLMSGEDNWSESIHPIVEEEKGGSLDFQLMKMNNIRNNNVVFRVTNQYGKAMPFFSVPIGGVPKYKYQIGVKYKTQ